MRETNICRISVHRDERTGRVIVFAAIDNLWKGAASQAVQNLNLMFGRPEGEGIAVSGAFFSQPLDRAAAAQVTELDGGGLPGRVSRRRRGRPGSSRAARPTSG